MKHLLDYDTLKEWGFIWASATDVCDEKIVTSYILQDTLHTDMFGLCPISLMILPDLNTGHKWYISVLDGKKKSEKLFKGRIRGKTDLKAILRSVIIFKPKPNPAL